MLRAGGVATLVLLVIPRVVQPQGLHQGRHPLIIHVHRPVQVQFFQLGARPASQRPSQLQHALVADLTPLDGQDLDPLRAYTERLPERAHH